MVPDRGLRRPTDERYVANDCFCAPSPGADGGREAGREEDTQMAKGVVGSIQRLMHFFLPKEEEFFEIFAEMGDRAKDAALLMHQMFENYPEIGNVVEEIAVLEHEVDHIRHDCVRRLNETFVTPVMFDRQDIFDLADILDDVVDFCRAAVDRTALYKAERVPANILKMTATLVEATALLAEACNRLEGIRGEAQAYVEKINNLENQADAMLKQGLADLFQEEKNAIEILKWKEIYDYVEEAIDHCEDTINLIEASLVKNS